MNRPLLPVNFPEPHLRRGIWIFAVCVALSCHLAFAAFAIANMQEDPDEADLGAAGLEVSFELASAQNTPTELPPGPESDASMQSAPAIEQKTAEASDLPKETPVESNEPDRLVTTEKVKTPEKDEPDTKVQMTNLSEASQAQEATAAPTIQNAPVAVKSTTRDQGTGESRQRIRVTWQKELVAHLDRHKRYPADRSQKSAEVVVTINMDRTGRVVSTNVARSSGDAAFDAAAIAMVQRSNPVPPPPPLVADEGLSFSLPVIFQKSKH
jgi:protein TonB